MNKILKQYNDYDIIKLYQTTENILIKKEIEEFYCFKFNNYRLSIERKSGLKKNIFLSYYFMAIRKTLIIIDIEENSNFFNTFQWQIMAQLNIFNKNERCPRNLLKTATDAFKKQDNGQELNKNDLNSLSSFSFYNPLSLNIKDDKNFDEDLINLIEDRNGDEIEKLEELMDEYNLSKIQIEENNSSKRLKLYAEFAFKSIIRDFPNHIINLFIKKDDLKFIRCFSDIIEKYFENNGVLIKKINNSENFFVIKENVKLKIIYKCMNIIKKPVYNIYIVYNNEELLLNTTFANRIGRKYDMKLHLT